MYSMMENCGDNRFEVIAKAKKYILENTNIETSKDDTGNTVKHYHIGKPDKSNSGTYSAQKSWWEKVVGNFKQTISYNS